jgi:hypothetical protein
MKSRWLIATALSSATLAGTGVQAQVPDASFAGRIFPVPAPEGGLADYKPNDAGYVRMVVEPAAVENAAFCPVNATQLTTWQNNWRARAGDVWRQILGRNRTSGSALRVWYGANALTPTDANAAMEVPLFQVAVPSNVANCQTDSSNVAARTPLVRLQDGSARFHIQFRRWYKQGADLQQLNHIRDAVARAGATAGMPAPFADWAASQGTRLFTNAIVTDAGSRHAETLDARDPTGSRTLRAFIGYKPASAPFRADDQTEARVNIRLVTVASLFAPETVSSYESLDLKNTSPTVLLDNQLPVQSDVKTVRGLITLKPERNAEYLRLISSTNADEFNGSCLRLRSDLQASSGLSDVDIAVALYSLGREHGILGDRGTQPRKFAETACIRNQAQNLARVKIDVIVTPPTPVPASADQMRRGVNYFDLMLRGQSDLVAKDVLQDTVTVLDRDGILGLGESTSLSSGAAAQRFIFGFGFAGCMLPSASGSQNVTWPWPVDRDRRATLVVLADRTNGNAYFARLLFDPAIDDPAIADDLPPRVSMIDLARQGGSYTEQIRGAYPGGCNGWKPKEIYPEAAVPAPPP